jgi:hypothetical protein
MFRTAYRLLLFAILITCLTGLSLLYLWGQRMPRERTAVEKIESARPLTEQVSSSRAEADLVPPR